MKGRVSDHQPGGRLEYVTDNGAIAPANTVGLNLDGAPMPCIDITTEAGREFAYCWEYFRWNFDLE